MSSVRVRLTFLISHNEFAYWLFPALSLSHRSMLSRAVRNTKRESSSSSWRTWLRTTAGSDCLVHFLSAQWPFRPLCSGLQSDTAHSYTHRYMHTPRYTLCHSTTTMLYTPTHSDSPYQCSETQHDRAMGRSRGGETPSSRSSIRTPPSALTVLRDVDARLEDLLRLSNWFLCRRPSWAVNSIWKNFSLSSFHSHPVSRSEW